MAADVYKSSDYSRFRVIKEISLAAKSNYKQANYRCNNFAEASQVKLVELVDS
jgi:hypothetical protein